MRAPAPRRPAGRFGEARGHHALETECNIYQFGPFRLHVTERQLLHNGVKVVTPKGKPFAGRAFDVLVRLVRRRGKLATREALLDEVWRNPVELHNVDTQVSNVRKLLEAYDPQTDYIATDPGHGYLFVVEVKPWEPAPEPPAPRLPEPETSDTAEPPPPPPPPAPPPPPVARDAHNLPAELNSFVGRASELADISRLLGGCAVLTLVGSGGVGKTRCAVRVGHAALPSYADGVWLVELAPMHDAALVAEAVCRAVGAPVSGERPAAEIAAAFLRHRNLLLILDNCEHVLEAAAALAATLARHCPGVKILATSRQALGIDGETVFRMPSLPLPPADAAMDAATALQWDAVRLFVDRGHAASGFRLTDADAPSVATICRRLDGVAMATELAAARLKMLKPAEIAARLEDVFRLLTGGSKAALPRQQTLRATIDWSFNLLEPNEQIALCRLSVFVDGFSLEGATSVAAGGPIDALDVLDLVQALVDKSLLNADTTGPATRYRILETTRHYARERLAEGGRGRRFRRMAEYLGEFYARAEATWSTTPTDLWLAEFAPEVENLRAAIDWAFDQSRRPEDSGDEPGDPSLGIALVAASGSVAEEMSLLADMKRWTAAAMKHISPATPKARAGWVLYWVTRHQSVFGVRELSDVRRQAISLFREADDRVGLSCALRTAGIAMTRPGEHSAEAAAMLTEAVEIMRPYGDTKDLASALTHLGSYHAYTGDDVLAASLTEEALTIRRKLGDNTGQIVSLINLAEFAFAAGRVSVAIDFGRQAVSAARRCAVLEILGTALANLSNYLLSAGDIAPGRQSAEEALKICRALGTEDYATGCLEHLALALFREGAVEQSAHLFGFTDAYFIRTHQVRDRSDQITCDYLRENLSRSFSVSKLKKLMQYGADWNSDRADSVALQQTTQPGPASELVGSNTSYSHLEKEPFFDCVSR